MNRDALPPLKGQEINFLAMSGGSGVHGGIRCQEWRQIILAENRVNFMNVVHAAVKCHNESHVAGNPSVERGHAVKHQGFLGFFQTEFRCEADPKNSVTFLRALLSGDQLVSVSFWKVGSEEYILLTDVLLTEFCPHVVRERAFASDQR